MGRLRLWLRLEFVAHNWKWLLVIVVALVLAIAFEIGYASLPHSVLNTHLKYQEKSNGLREFPNGVHGIPSEHAGK
jgi:uncharacterized protein YpmS